MSVYRFRKEELETHLNKGALWAIVYGDLMSYLMILFLLMLSYTLSKDKKRSPVEDSLVQIQRIFGGKIDPERAERARRKDQERMISQNLAAKAKAGELGEARLIVTEKRITLNLGEGILFASGEAELKPGAGEVLRVVMSDMLSAKNEIRVEGHTDNVPVGRRGRWRSNWELSMARAYSVIKMLEDLGVEPQRISGVGYGEYRPVEKNDNASGRAANRRIEVSLLREE